MGKICGYYSAKAASVGCGLMYETINGGLVLCTEVSIDGKPYSAWDDVVMVAELKSQWPTSESMKRKFESEIYRKFPLKEEFINYKYIIPNNIIKKY
jgi:hypothetical protein